MSCKVHDTPRTWTQQRDSGYGRIAVRTHRQMIPEN